MGFIEDALARNPQWASLMTTDGQGNVVATNEAAYGAGSSPQTDMFQVSPANTPYGSQGLPPSASTGTIPLVSNNLPLPAVPASQGGNPMVAQWEAAQNTQGAQQRYIGAQEAYTSLQPGARAAKSTVLDAQQKDLAANESYLREQERANQQRIKEEKAIQAAKGNVEDITNVGREMARRQDYSYRYNLAGISTPVEVTLPEGWEGPLPPGVVKRVRFLHEILTDKAQDAEAMRRFYLEAARIKSANTGLEVTAAQIKAGRYALKLDEAEEAVNLAQLAVSKATLAERAADIPPREAIGMVWDETTNSYQSPSQASLNRKLQQARFETETLGLAAESPAQLKEWAVNGQITDDQLYEALVVTVGEARARLHVLEAQAARAKKEEGGGGIDVASYLKSLGIDLGGDTSTPTTPTDTTPFVPWAVENGLPVNPSRARIRGGWNSTEELAP